MQVTIVTIEPNPLTHGYEYAILNKIQNDRCIWRRIRNLRCSCVVYLGFTNEEYHIVCVDFIYSSRGRLKRDRGFANPLSLSNTSPDPWGIRCGGEISAAAVDRDIGSFIPVQIACPQVRIWFFYLCSGWGFSRFSRFRLACIVRFSLVVGWTVRSCGYVVFCYGLSLGLPLTATFLPILYGASPFHQYCRVQEYCKNAFVRLVL